MPTEKLAMSAYDWECALFVLWFVLGPAFLVPVSAIALATGQLDTPRVSQGLLVTAFVLSSALTGYGLAHELWQYMTNPKVSTFELPHQGNSCCLGVLFQSTLVAFTVLLACWKFASSDVEFWTSLLQGTPGYLRWSLLLSMIISSGGTLAGATRLLIEEEYG